MRGLPWPPPPPLALALLLVLALAFPARAAIPLGSLHGHFSLAETEAWLNRTAEEFTLTTKLFTIGQSVENREIWAMCVGYECHKPDSTTPEALYTALHHAREPMGLTALLIFLDAILRPCANETESMEYLLRSRRLYFVLVVNPDGYKLNEVDPGMQRKNARIKLDTKCPLAAESAQFGVDLNRNYDFCFNKDRVGSSTRPCDVDYQGPSPFSEPETRAMKALVEAHKFRVGFNYHSFGRQVLIPYSCKPMGKTKDEEFIDRYAKRLVHANKYPYGQAWRSNLYSVNGDASDWMYHFHGIIAVSPEVSPPDPVPSEHDGFWVSPPSKVLGYASETLIMNFVGAWTVGTWLELSNFKLVENGTVLEFVLTNEGMEPAVGQVRVLFVSATQRINLGPVDAPPPRGLAPVTLLMSGAQSGSLMAWDSTSCTMYNVSNGVTKWISLRARCSEATAPSSLAPTSLTLSPVSAASVTASPGNEKSTTPEPATSPNASERKGYEGNSGGLVFLLACVLFVVIFVALRRRRRALALLRDDLDIADEEEREGLV